MSVKKQLRPYQQQSCQSIAKSWARGERPYAALITGTGKSLVLAALTNRYINEGERVLQLVPRLELVEQNYIEAFNYMDDKTSLGIVCGQLGKRQNTRRAVIAMASSFVNCRATSGKFDKLLIDECHRMVMRKESDKGTYHKIVSSLLRINPNMKICGVTGTPYRNDQGELHDESHKVKPFFTHKVFDSTIEPGLKKLISEGYLSHIETLNSVVRVDLNGVKLSGYDFNKEQVGVKFDAIIDNAVNDMRMHFIENNIKTALIFASNITNALHIISAWNDALTMRVVCGRDDVCTKEQRKSAIEWMKNGVGNRYIVNVDILTEGFDFKALQAVVLLRATTSPGLLIQMVGRVIRPHGEKESGFLLDYGTNIERLTKGGIESIIVPKIKPNKKDSPKKLCTAINDGITCNHINILSAKKCAKCGAEFIVSDDGNYSMRTVSDALALKQEQKKIIYDVTRTTFESSISKSGINIIKMFFIDKDGLLLHVEYICIEHTGQAKGLAIAKIKDLMKNPRSDWYQIGKFEGGHNVKNMLFLFNEYYDQYFKQIKKITIVKENKFNKLIAWEF